jgi:putative signal transducing protein
MSSPDPNVELVVVLESSNRIELSIAESVLEDAGIPFFVLGQIATLMQDVDPFLHKRFRLQVPADREAEARELLEHLPQPVPLDDEGAATSK